MLISKMQSLNIWFFSGNFTFAVVEIFKVDPDVSMGTNKARLLAMEQVYLAKWAFSLPEELCYNFLPTAGSSLGYKHTPEARDQ